VINVRAVYYRVYSPDGAVASKQPFISDNKYLGRADVAMVAPPHTANTYKRFLCKQEGIDDSSAASLFESILSDAALEGNTRIVPPTGPGSSPETAMALVLSDVPEPVAKFNNIEGDESMVLVTPGALETLRSLQQTMVVKTDWKYPAAVNSRTYKMRVRTRRDHDNNGDDYLDFEDGETLYTDGIEEGRCQIIKHYAWIYLSSSIGTFIQHYMMQNAYGRIGSKLRQVALVRHILLT
jgi:hypothetical protein